MGVNERDIKRILFSPKGSLQKTIEMSKSIEITKHPLKTQENADKKSTVEEINHFKHKGHSHTRDKKAEETTCTRLRKKNNNNNNNNETIGLLQLAVTWYKIRHAGWQAYYYSRTGTAKQCYFILSSLNFLCFGCPSAGIIISLPSSMADFVPCDR